VVWTVVVLAVVGGLLLLLWFPTRAWLDQRADVSQTEERLAVLRAANDDLQGQVTALQTPEEIERVAREQYHLVRPGEQVYSVLPAGLPDQLPAGWPFDLVSRMLVVRAAPLPPPPTSATATTIPGASVVTAPSGSTVTVAAAATAPTSAAATADVSPAAP
jgi:cell division protein FtsB